MPITLASSRDQIARCFPVMQQLRPHLQSEAEFVTRAEQQMTEGFKLAMLEHEGKIVTVAGFRVQNMLASGLTMYVDDLVTGEAFRSHGHGKVMLDWLMAHASERACETFSLDSGTQRREAHAFYFRENMRISSFHFMLPLR
jgi:GNAT superfamily N-acetyltransferase